MASLSSGCFDHPEPQSDSLVLRTGRLTLVIWFHESPLLFSCDSLTIPSHFLTGSSGTLFSISVPGFGPYFPLSTCSPRTAPMAITTFVVDTSTLYSWQWHPPELQSQRSPSLLDIFLSQTQCVSKLTVTSPRLDPLSVFQPPFLS